MFLEKKCSTDGRVMFTLDAETPEQELEKLMSTPSLRRWGSSLLRYSAISCRFWVLLLFGHDRSPGDPAWY
ncbi:hypothetical protein D6D13_01443 [Aureobasidium pullulans]|uniref:Uncharacterized protein n=1 Tax=Aureobasidium pullulans TaxID=5580 RepID=A0A4T0CPR0_AURPU|nr:hypothetical protein D6D13_01443 [Aureobasidium pullulans]TIA50100.1 hypothetical protein D6C79_03228 [Aureobasidium pullulans]